jgi:DNA-binding transcriptional MerR regulator
MPDPDPLMSIGVFSTATLVSIKALRLYHEQGLLVPASIDPATGYRFYRVSQLSDAQVIKRLRELDLPLAAVAEVVRARDPHVTQRVISEHEQVMRNRLEDMSQLVAELQQVVSNPSLQTPAFVRTEPSQHVLAISELVVDPGHDTYAAFLGSAFARLYESCGRLGLIGSDVSVTGALYPPKVDGDSELISAFVPVDGPVMLDDRSIAIGVINMMLPSATCAVLGHSGSYQSLGDTYRKLGAWVATNAVVLDLPVREWYIVSTDITGNLLPDAELRTEIAWPIQPTRSTHVSHAKSNHL